MNIMIDKIEAVQNGSSLEAIFSWNLPYTKSREIVTTMKRVWAKSKKGMEN